MPSVRTPDDSTHTALAARAARSTLAALVAVGTLSTPPSGVAAPSPTPAASPTSPTTPATAQAPQPASSGPLSADQLAWLLDELTRAPVVAGAPLQATLHYEGGPARAPQRSSRRFARDALGRTWQELGNPRAGGAYPMAAIADPRSGELMVLVHATRSVMRLQRGSGPTQASPASAPARTRAATLAPPPWHAATPSPVANAAAAEALGTRTLQGLNALGQRSTSATGVRIERWTSPQLQLDLEVRTTAPDGQQARYWLSGVSLGEPPAALFEPPAGYRAQAADAPAATAGKTPLGPPVYQPAGR